MAYVNEKELVKPLMDKVLNRYLDVELTVSNDELKSGRV